MIQQDSPVKQEAVLSIAEMSWGAFQVTFRDIPVVQNMTPEQAKAIITQAKADGRYEGFDGHDHHFTDDNDYGRLIPELVAASREHYEASFRPLRRVGTYERPYARHRGKGIIYVEAE